MADTTTALRKLQSGQTLTDEEKKLLGMTVTPTKASALTQAEIDAKTAEQVAAGIKSTSKEARLEGETYAQANARLTQGYKDQPKPELTQEGVTGGATLEYVRTGSGGVGEYKEVYPIGTPIPDTRTTVSGNVYDAQGNLIAGSGLKPGQVGAGDNTVRYGTSEADRSPIATIREGGSSAGKDATGKDVYYKIEGDTVGFYYADGSKVPTDNLIGVKQAVDFANAGRSVQGLEKGKTPAEIKYADLIKAEMDKGAQPGGNAYVRGDVVVVNDSNGVSLYDLNGNLLSGKGSTNQIGIGSTDGRKINIASVGIFGSPEYNLNKAFNVTNAATGIGTGTGAGTGLGTGGGTIVDTGGSTGGTAFDIFKNTLSLFFGPAEMTKPWVSQLYKTVSGFTKSGSTPEEAFNMAVLESEKNPAMADFAKRFKGIYSLQKMKQEGKAVTVPTVAEYFATESKMGDILKASNLGDLANEEFLGDVLSKGVSATEFGNRITAIFDRIDTAPDVVKKTVGRYFPTLDRTQLAKALALGDKGAKQLEQELAGYEVLAGAGAQGLEASTALPGGITLEQAQQIAKGGGTYASTLGQFGQIAGARETEQKLAEISGVKSIGVTGLTSAVINKSATELKKLEDLTKQEEARFAAKAGTIGSKSLASQSRANRVI